MTIQRPFHRRLPHGPHRGNQFYSDRGPSPAERTACGGPATDIDIPATGKLEFWRRADGVEFIPCEACRIAGVAPTTRRERTYMLAEGDAELARAWGRVAAISGGVECEHDGEAWQYMASDEAAGHSFRHRAYHVPSFRPDAQASDLDRFIRHGRTCDTEIGGCPVRIRPEPECSGVYRVYLWVPARPGFVAPAVSR